MNSSDPNDLISLITKTTLFNSIPVNRIAELLPQLKHLHLQAGDLLFSQGSPSDSVFVLLKGKLIAFFVTETGQPKVVGMIEPYETTGELGAISAEPRSLSVKAEVKSEVIEVPSDIFRKLCEEFPSILFNIVRPLVNRSLKTIKLLQPESKPEHILIFPANNKVNFDEFKQKITYTIEKNVHPNLIVNPVKLNDNLNTGQQNNNNKEKVYITFIDSNTHPQVVKKLKEKSNNFYLLADGTKQPGLDEFAHKIITENITSEVKLHLILLYPGNYQEFPKYTTQWLEQYDFFLHHHVHKNSARDYQRLFRFLNGTPVGLVLGGGGARGLAHLGVIKGLLEKEIPIDAVCGTSIGSMVAACYASTESYEKMCERFHYLLDNCYKVLSFRKLVWPIVSVLSSSPITEAVEELFDDLRIENLWLKYFCVSANLSTRKQCIHETGLIWQALRTSASPPGLVPPVVIDGQLHFDGGLLNNLPVDVMKNLLGPKAKIIASKLSISGIDKRVFNFPPTLTLKETLLYKLGYGNKDYQFPAFLEMFMNSLVLGSSEKEETNASMADLLINPNVFKFKSITVMKTEKKLIELGYQETIKLLAEKKNDF